MIIDKKVEVVEAEVNFLEDLDVSWVSLVPHGANRMPFKIIKSEDGADKEENMLDVIYSVIVPNGVELDVLKEEVPWLNGVKFIKTENYNEYKSYIQVPYDRFDPDKMNIVKLDKGVMVLVGKVDNPDPEWVSIGKDITDPSGPSPTIPAFKESFVSELNNVINVLVGAVSQSHLPDNKRKSIISNSLEAFKVFMLAGIDHGGFATAKSEVPELIVRVKEKEEVMSDVTVKEELQEKVEAVEKEEKAPSPTSAIDALISKIDTLVEKLDALSKPKEEEVQKSEEENPPVEENVFEKFEEKLNAMGDILDKVVAKIEKIEALDSTIPEPVSKSEDRVSASPKQNDADIWAGAIFRN